MNLKIVFLLVSTLNRQRKTKATLNTRAEQSARTKLGPRPITEDEAVCRKSCKLTFYTSNISLTYQAQVKGVWRRVLRFHYGGIPHQALLYYVKFV